MNKVAFFLIIMFLLSIIICNDINKHQKSKKKKQKKQKGKDNKINEREQKFEENEEKIEKENVKEEEEEEIKEEENYNEKYRGIYMTQKAYYRKYNRIFEERGLKGKKKITKEQLKTIFDEIYKEEKDNEDSDKDEGEGGSGNALYLIFNEIFKSYDYDDYININKGLKKLMNPKNVQDAMYTIYADMAGSMGYL